MSRKKDDYSEAGFTVPYTDAKPDSSEVPLDELDNFIVPGRDEHGAHQTATFNSPPLLVHQIDVIVRSQLFPYINREAFLRHAAVRHMRWLQDIRPESLTQHIAPAIEAMLERCFQSQMRKKVQAAFDALRETTIQCQNDGEFTEVLRLCYYVRQRLKEVDPGSVWQQRAWKKFIAEFGDNMDDPSYFMSGPATVGGGMNAGMDLNKVGQVGSSPGPVVEKIKPATRLVRHEIQDEGETVN